MKGWGAVGEDEDDQGEQQQCAHHFHHHHHGPLRGGRAVCAARDRKARKKMSAGKLFVSLAISHCTPPPVRLHYPSPPPCHDARHSCCRGACRPRGPGLSRPLWGAHDGRRPPCRGRRPGGPAALLCRRRQQGRRRPPVQVRARTNLARPAGLGPLARTRSCREPCPVGLGPLKSFFPSRSLYLRAQRRPRHQHRPRLAP